MKKLYLILLTLMSFSLMAQNLDVTVYSQNIALADPQGNKQEIQRQTAAYPYISESYEIPAYGLYQKYWDTVNIRSKMLEIPFSNDRLMLMLVQDANNPFVMPCQFEKIKTTYGETKNGGFHPGIDLKTEPQTLVKSCFDGVVRIATYYGDYGLMVVVRHYNGLETVYAHLDKLCVTPHQIVKAGQVIGQTGTTGNTKECILHFETRFMNEYFDPELVIDFEEEDVLQNNMALMSRDFNIISLEEVGNWKPAAPKPSAAPAAKPAVNQEVKQEVATQPKKQEAEEETVEETPKTETVNPTTTPQETAVYHTVKAGENLYRISVKYNTTVDNILKLNNLKNADKIVEGQKLRVK
ncbi:MAG: peptidoglycan DD-metalloendopeptidase family protein [Bacteroidales bacterium]|nr:peptidoglycan DD-metalloendopeptidase family protein [Bacteroidales bacterium]